MNQTQELERRLHETLRAKARQIDLTDEPYSSVLPRPELVGSTRRSRRGFAAIAAALTVAAAATGAVVVARSHGRSPIVATQSSSHTAPQNGPNPIPAPLLAPSWVPDGEQLWSLTASTQDGAGYASQLFGMVAADGTLAPGLLVELQPASPGDGLGEGTTVTVRGKAGVTRASKDAGVDTFEIDWIEGDAMVRVTVRGASVDEAVAAHRRAAASWQQHHVGLRRGERAGALPVARRSSGGEQCEQRVGHVRVRGRGADRGRNPTSWFAATSTASIPDICGS